MRNVGIKHELTLTINGRTTTASGNPVYGVRVALVDDGDRVLGHTLSATNGAFAIAASLEPRTCRRYSWLTLLWRSLHTVWKRKVERESNYTLVVSDANARRLATVEVPAERTAESPVLDILIEDHVKWEPLAVPLGRLTDGILDPESIRVLKLAVEPLAPDDAALRTHYWRQVEDMLPPAANSDHLLDEAWAVLDAQPLAEARLRRALRVMLPTVAASRPRLLDNRNWRLAWREALLAGPYANLDTPRAPFARSFARSIVPPERFAALAAAVLTISKSPQDARELFQAVEHGLKGLDHADGLLDAAHECLRSDDPATFGILIKANDSPPKASREQSWPPGAKAPPDDQESPEIPSVPGSSEHAFLDPSTFERWGIIDGLINASPAPPPGGYWIDNIKPAAACAGDELIITESGFGSRRAEVCFAGKNLPVCVKAHSWTDSQIKVRVPQGAHSGLVHLRDEGKPWEASIRIGPGGKPILVPKQNLIGNAVHFKGGLPKITNIRVNGKMLKDIIASPPHGYVAGQRENVTISWYSDADEVDIQVTGGEIATGATKLPAGPGSFTFTTPRVWWDPTVKVRAPSFNPNLVERGLFGLTWDKRVPVKMKVEIWAKNQCGQIAEKILLYVYEKPTLKISGIEVTQGIQTFRTEGAVVHENTVPAVASKDTYVRVYVAADRHGFWNNLVRFTGVLYVDGFLLHPINPFATASPQPKRTEAKDSLNFRIPAQRCSGTRTLRVEIEDDELAPSGYPSPMATAKQSISWSWTSSKPLAIRYYRCWDKLKSKTTSDQEARETCEGSFNYLPSPASDIEHGPCSVVLPIYYDNMQEALNGVIALKTLWSSLLAQHRTMHDRLRQISRHGNAIWVAVTPSALNQGQLAGLAFIGRKFAAARAATPKSPGAGSALAHEIGHYLGLGHIKTPGTYNTAKKAPGGPTYRHPNGGWLADTGFRVIGGKAHTYAPKGAQKAYARWEGSAIAVADIMSYSGNRYTSVPTWNHFLRRFEVLIP